MLSDTITHYLNNIRVLLKDALTDSRARNFVHAKTSACTLRARLSPCAQFVGPCKTYDHQIWQADTSTGFDSNETNQAGAADAIASKSRNKLKTYLHYQSAYGY